MLHFLDITQFGTRLDMTLEKAQNSRHMKANQNFDPRVQNLPTKKLQESMSTLSPRAIAEDTGLRTHLSKAGFYSRPQTSKPLFGAASSSMSNFGFIKQGVRNSYNQMEKSTDQSSVTQKSLHFAADLRQQKEEEEKQRTKERLFTTGTAKNLKTIHMKSFNTINNALRKQSIKVESEYRTSSANISVR